MTANETLRAMIEEYRATRPNWLPPEPTVDSQQQIIDKLRARIRYLEYQIETLRASPPAYNPYQPHWPAHPANPYFYHPKFTC